MVAGAKRIQDTRSKDEDILVSRSSKEVFALADFYSDINYSNPLRDPRVHAVVQDGRFFLQASPRQYDIISGEPHQGRRNRHFLAADQSAESR